MKGKYEGKDLQSLVELGREQGYLIFDQVNDFLPQDVSSPTDLRSALESFQDMDIKILTDVPKGELEAEGKDGPDETAEPAPAADSIGESSDPVRLYLKEMGNFQLLSREQGDSNPRDPSVPSWITPSTCCTYEALKPMENSSPPNSTSTVSLALAHFRAGRRYRQRAARKAELDPVIAFVGKRAQLAHHQAAFA
jgi:hypothetical protein